MFVNAATERSLDLIAQRASDVYRAFVPGALPGAGDVETAVASSRFDVDPLSVSAADGDYFVTNDERGSPAYVRSGGFTIARGTLVAFNGRPVLGYRDARDTLAELRVDPVDDALGHVRNARVEPDGSVVYERPVVEPRSGGAHTQRVCIGRLALARFPAATKLAAGSDESVTPPHGVVAHLGRPGDGNFRALTPMRRDESRIDLNRSLERLHDAYVAFDALQAAHKAQGQTGKIAMDLLK